jgi:hypothetical protein
MHKKTIGVCLGIAVAHYVVSFLLLLATAGLALGRLDQGGGPTVIEAVTSPVIRVLTFPFVTFAPPGIPGGAQMFLFGLNSALWGVVIGGVVLAVKQQTRRAL